MNYHHISSFSSLPARLRIGLPLLGAANVALLVMAHVSKGASTEVKGTAPFGQLKPHTVTDDNLFSAIGRLSEAHVWFMVFIVAILSGMWPYMKIAATLGTVGLVDAGVLSKTACHKMLCALEVLGKYSFADVFLVCFNMVIFEISTNGEYRIMVFGKFELDLFMQLKFGAVALISAVAFSALLTHWAAFEIDLLLLRCSSSCLVEESIPLLAQEADLQRDGPTGESVDKTGVPRALQDAPWIGRAIALAATGGFVALALGLWLPMLDIERGGFLGHIIRPPESRNLHLSVASMSSAMLTSAASKLDLAYLFFAVLFVLLTVIAPLLELVALIVCAMSDVQTRWQNGVVLVAAWLSSVGCIDVLLLVCLATLFEVQMVVDFNVGRECAAFADIMNDKVVLGLAGLGFAASSSCFELVPRLRTGWWCLLGSVLLRSLAWRLQAMRKQGASSLTPQ